MGKIQALSENVIGKIAAGEVVERPAAAVKELTENSLDAGATSITVEIRQEGTDYFRVTDNGCGIDPGDLKMAFERHATSKIRREDDLNAIATLGFRGEALASIAAVSRVTLITRTADQDTGVKVQNEGGQIVSIEETACPTGTTIIVRDLFYNTPVRRNFLKKPSAEIGAVSDLAAHLILSRPDVSFRLISAGKTIYHSPGDGKLASAVHAVFGSTALKQMRPVDGHMNGVLLTGFAGIGDLARSNRNGEYFFINRRMMRSAALSAALENACRERVMIGRFPMGILQLEVPYETVNVNVHPNKLEVRFQNERAVCEAVETLVREALEDRDAFEKPVEMSLSKPEKQPPEPSEQRLREAVRTLKEEPRVSVILGSAVPPAATTIPEENRVRPEPVLRETGLSGNGQSAVAEGKKEDQKPDPAKNIPKSVKNTDLNTSDSTPAPLREETAEQLTAELPKPVQPIRIFGALFDTYILIEYADQLLLVDQHAVHERLLFDQLSASFGKERLGQELLVPVTMSVTREEMRLLEENRELLESIGLAAEPFGETDVAVRMMPMILGDVPPADFLREVLGDLESGRAPTFEKKRTALLQTACKHAVKGGERLDESQLRHLAEQMIEKKVTPTCPHGRPLVVSVSHRELDKKFKRIQD